MLAVRLLPRFYLGMSYHQGSITSMLTALYDTCYALVCEIIAKL